MSTLTGLYDFTVKSFTSEQIRGDLVILKEILSDLHPSLYWHNSKSEIDKLFAELVESISQNEDEVELYIKLLKVISKLRCGHTWLNASDSLSGILWAYDESFPLKVKLVDNKLFYSGESLQNSIQTGNQIVSINNKNSSQLIERFSELIIGDGYIESGKSRTIERRFGYYYFLLFSHSNTHELQYLASDQNRRTITIDKFVHKPEPVHPNIQFTNIHEGNGYLKILNFSDWNQHGRSIPFDSVLSNAFYIVDSLSLPNLIIDLRDNRGGSDKLGQLLLSHLFDKPILEFTRIYSRPVNNKYLRDYSNLDQEFLDELPEYLSKMDDSTFILINQPGTKPYNPSTPNFKGQVYVLINGNTFSTAADVSAILYSNNRATFIGEETGGGYYGSTSGIVAQITLPETRFVLHLPLLRYDTNVKQLIPRGRGVIPHYAVDDTQESLISGTDLQLNTTLDLTQLK